MNEEKSQVFQNRDPLEKEFQNCLSEEALAAFNGSEKSGKGREFSGKEQILAWLSFLVGAFFCRIVFFEALSVFKLVFTFALFAFAFVFYGKNRREKRCFFYPVTALVLSFSFFFSGSGVMHALAFFYILFAFLMFCLTGGDQALEKKAGSLYFFECVKAIFVSPFLNFVSVYRAIGKSGKRSGFGKAILWVVIGIAAAVIPTLIVGSLLSYDEEFAETLRTIRSFFGTEFLIYGFLSLALGVPTAMYIYGALCSSTEKENRGISAESGRKFSDAVKVVPAAASAAAMAPLLILYVLFVVSQRGFFSSVFSGTLPAAHTLASFARLGFYNLLAVAVINAGVLILLRTFTRKNKKGEISAVVRVASVCLSVLTLAMSAIAVSQMIMYVSEFGLTARRLFALSFMALLSLIFLVSIFRQFIRRLPFTAICLVLVVLFIGAMALPDTDTLIARFNYDCYVSGSSEEIDVSYLRGLGDAAIPTLIDLSRGQGKAAEEARCAIGAYAEFRKENAEFTFPSLRASSAYDAMSEKEKEECRNAYLYGKSQFPLPTDCI